MPVSANIPISITSEPPAIITGVRVTLNQRCNPSSSVSYTEADSEVSLSSSSIQLNSEFGTCPNIEGTVVITTTYNGINCEGSVNFTPDFESPVEGILEITNAVTGQNIGTLDGGSYQQNKISQTVKARLKNVGDGPLKINNVIPSSTDLGIQIVGSLPTNRILSPGSFVDITHNFDTSLDKGNYSRSFNVNWEDINKQIPQTGSYSVTYSVSVKCPVQLIEVRLDYSSSRDRWVETASSDAVSISSEGNFTRSVQINNNIPVTASAVPIGQLSVQNPDTVNDVRNSLWILGNDNLKIVEKIPPVTEYFRAAIRIRSVEQVSPGNFTARIIFGALDHARLEDSKNINQRETSGRTLRVVGTIANRTFDSGNLNTPLNSIPSSNDYTITSFSNPSLPIGIYADVVVKGISLTDNNKVTCVATVYEGRTEIAKGTVEYYFKINCP